MVKREILHNLSAQIETLKHRHHHDHHQTKSRRRFHLETDNGLHLRRASSAMQVALWQR